MSVINKEEVNQKYFCSSKLNLKENIPIAKFEKNESKVLTNNSFYKKVTYDLTQCQQLDEIRKNLIEELNKLEPEMGIFIKSKITTFQTKIKTEKGFATTSNEFFNTVHFNINRDDVTQTFWINVTVSYNVELGKKLK